MIPLHNWGPEDIFIVLNDDEMVKLIQMGHQVEAAFGPGWVALKWKVGEPMPETVQALGLMRGVLNENMYGAGI